jgi:hypothetical protein
MVTDIWMFSDRAIAVVDLTGFEVEATDGRVGRVNRSIGTSGSEHLVVDAQSTFGRDRSVVIPAGLVDSVDTQGRRLRLNRTQQELQQAPAYDAGRGIDASYRSALDTHFGAGRGASRRQSPSRSTSRRGEQRRRSSGGRSRSSGRSQRDEPTKAELYDRAKRLGIEGRSKMSKAQLQRAVERGGETRGRSRSQAPANPIEVQSFLEGVNYPTRKGQLVQQARREGASNNVRSTLERLPDKQFKDPTDVSEAIGKLS